MVNNSTNINNANNHLASWIQIKYHDIWHWISRSWLETSLYLPRAHWYTPFDKNINTVMATIHSDWDADCLLENPTTQSWHICLSIESLPISEWYRRCIYTVYQCDILLTDVRHLYLSKTNQMNRSVTCFLTKTNV